MRTLIPILLAACLSACDAIDPAGPPLLNCELWTGCPGALIVHTEVVKSGFRRQHPSLYMPGDSFVVRIRVQNRAKVRSDSLFLSYNGVGFVGGGAIGDSVVTPGGWKTPVLVLGPGEIREVLDTLVVRGYTFDDETRMEFWAWNSGLSKAVDVRVTGNVHFPIATSGYKFEVVVGPQGTTEVVQHGDHTHNAKRIRHKTDVGVLARISNPYQMPLDPISIEHCLWDGDHGYVCGSAQADMPRLESGRDVYAEYFFNFDTEGHYHDWWASDYTALTVCPERGNWGRQCHWVDVLVTANFAADCPVLPVAQVGVAMRDETAECGYWKDGSAYAFTAKKGERFRVSLLTSTTAEVFITNRDGAHFNKPRLTELLIPEDGTYYVVILHRNAVQFRLDKVS